MSSPTLQYIEVLIALAGILLLAYATLKLGLPRLLGMHVPSRGPIKIVARYPLEPRKTLYLVQAGSQLLLLGSSENRVQYLTTLTDENAAGILQSAQEERPRKDFRALLNRFPGFRESSVCDPPTAAEE